MAHGLEKDKCDKISKPDKLLVGAIDFGTTCTGYAYSLTQDYEKDSLNIWTKQSWTRSPEIGLQAPTSILFEPDQTFHSFGFEAEEKYTDLAFYKKEREWYFFRHFKMILYDVKNLTRETMLEAANQKVMKASVVFTAAIRYATDHLYKTITTAHGDVKRLNIRWVLTVPAIWSDSAKMFMREAAEAAGIERDKLSIALEPEAASIYCKEQAIRIVDQDGRAILQHFNPGHKYMVLDLGGGTVDVAINEVRADGKLKEIYAASGGPWGGTTVNKAFRESIEDTVGKETFMECLLQDQFGWIAFEKEFEAEKRKFDLRNIVAHKLRLPNYFTNKPNLNLAEKFKAKHAKDIEVKEGFLVIQSSKMLEYFNTAIVKIINHINSLLKVRELSQISSVMLVGGFAESRVVQEKIIDSVKPKKVFVPPEPGSSVLKGSVMFGHSPSIIAQRISPWTYGVHTRKAFDGRIHDSNRKQKIGGKEYVNNAFDKHLEIGESVMVGESSLGRVYKLINPQDSRVFWRVYKSEKKNPVYCNEEEVAFLGNLVVDLPRDKGNKTWRFKLQMTCRGTELEASVRDADTEEQFKNKRYDFLRSEYESGSDFIQE